MIAEHPIGPATFRQRRLIFGDDAGDIAARQFMSRS
jgi:hypothetical protein